MRPWIGLPACLAGFFLPPAPLLAESWTVTGLFSQSAIAVQDFGDGGDRGFRSVTSLGFNAASRTPSTAFALSTALRLTARTDATGNSDDVEISTPSLNARVNGNAPNTTYSMRFVVDPEFVSGRALRDILLEDPDTGDVELSRVRVEEDPLQIDLRATGSVSYALDERNRVTTTAGVFRREYDNRSENFVPTTRANLGVAWSNALTSTTSGGFNGQLRYFRSDDSSTNDTLTMTVRAQASHRATARHNLSGSAGFTVLDDGDDVNVRFSGSANLGYSGLRSNYGLSLSQDIRQNDDGDLENVLRLNGRAFYRLTDNSSLRFGAVASLASTVDDPIGSDAERRYGVTASYTLQLAERWGISAGGGVRFSDDAGSQFDSEGQVFIRLSREFDILP